MIPTGGRIKVWPAIPVQDPNDRGRRHPEEKQIMHSYIFD